jgi:hypothetical protein
MQLPEIFGTCNQSNTFIYTACDQSYFDDFAKTLVTSIERNTDLGIHVHIFNPSDAQLQWCQSKPTVSYTYEYVTPAQFDPAAQRWNTVPVNEPEKSFYQRTLTAMTKGKDRSIQERMMKTYFACARFVRLAELFSNQQIIAIDVDAVVRDNFPSLPQNKDFYIHYISGKKARYLAGGLVLHSTASSQKFLEQYAHQLKEYFERDYVYWGLDQDLLDRIVPQYNHGQLPMSMIDWNMAPDSVVWTAKGTRKDDEKFLIEKKKYIS